MTPEKMEITSLTGPDRTIGDFLKELKLVEGRNTGISTILRAMERNGSPLPVFETDADRTYFTVILPAQESFLHSKVVVGYEDNKVQRKKKRSRAEIKEMIVEELKISGELSSNELAFRLGYQKLTADVSGVMKELMEDGIVEYSNPGKPRSSKQTIRLL